MAILRCGDTRKVGNSERIGSLLRDLILNLEASVNRLLDDDFNGVSRSAGFNKESTVITGIGG